MSSFLISLVSRFGLAGILVTMAGESAGLPISSEIVVPLGGALSSQGRLSFWAVVVFATIGNLIGSLVAFWLTRRYGEVVVMRYGRKVGVRQSHVNMARRFFNRYGLAAVFIGRLLPVIRTYISFPAGLSRMSYLSFSAVTFVGAFPWNLGLAYAGLQLGKNYHYIEKNFGWVSIVFLVIVVAILGALFVLGRRVAEEVPEPV